MNNWSGKLQGIIVTFCFNQFPSGVGERALRESGADNERDGGEGRQSGGCDGQGHQVLRHSNDTFWLQRRPLFSFLLSILGVPYFFRWCRLRSGVNLVVICILLDISNIICFKRPTDKRFDLTCLWSWLMAPGSGQTRSSVTWCLGPPENELMLVVDMLSVWMHTWCTVTVHYPN